MNFVDIGIGLLLVVGLFRGFRKGFIIGVASLVALVVGIYGAIHFSYIAGEYLAQYLNWSERVITVCAFVFTLLVIVFLVHLMGRVLTAIVNVVLLGLLNKMAGGLFGMLKVSILLGALFIFFERFPLSLTLIGEETKKSSLFYEPLRAIGTLVFTYIPEAKQTVEEAMTVGVKE